MEKLGCQAEGLEARLPVVKCVGCGKKTFKIVDLSLQDLLGKAAEQRFKRDYAAVVDTLNAARGLCQTPLDQARVRLEDAWLSFARRDSAVARTLALEIFQNPALEELRANAGIILRQTGGIPEKSSSAKANIRISGKDTVRNPPQPVHPKNPPPVDKTSNESGPVECYRCKKSMSKAEWHAHVCGPEPVRSISPLQALLNKSADQRHKKDYAGVAASLSIARGLCQTPLDHGRVKLEDAWLSFSRRDSSRARSLALEIFQNPALAELRTNAGIILRQTGGIPEKSAPTNPPNLPARKDVVNNTPRPAPPKKIPLSKYIPNESKPIKCHHCKQYVSKAMWPEHLRGHKPGRSIQEVASALKRQQPAPKNKCEQCNQLVSNAQWSDHLHSHKLARNIEEVPDPIDPEQDEVAAPREVKKASEPLKGLRGELAQWLIKHDFPVDAETENPKILEAVHLVAAVNGATELPNATHALTEKIINLEKERIKKSSALDPDAVRTALEALNLMSRALHWLNEKKSNEKPPKSARTKTRGPRSLMYDRNRMGSPGAVYDDDK